MMLNIKKLAFYMVSILSILVFSLSVNFTVKANVLLEGQIKIGDKNNNYIHPKFMLNATDDNGQLGTPTPVNPIHFLDSNIKCITQTGWKNGQLNIC